MSGREKETAKQVILEIIRQAGGTLNYKTSLFKAFYHAHLHFAENQPGYLSTWPIVRMSRGPGIDQFDVLIGELLAEGAIETQQIECGDYEGFQFRIGKSTSRRNVLPPGAIDSIAYGVQQVKGKTAKQVSDESHAVSRAWRESRDGDELNIYTDLLGPAEYEDRKRRASQIAASLQGVWEPS